MMLRMPTKKPTGVLNLDVCRKNGVSVSDDVYFQGAFKVMRPQYLDDTGQVMYCLLNPGGGYLDGDRYQIDLNVRKNADLYLTMQSATKIYKTPNDRVKQAAVINVHENGILEYASDPIIPFQDSTYLQRQTINLTASSSLFISDLVTPGWSADQKGFQYDRLSLKTIINYEDKLAVTDHLVLEPKVDDIAGMGFLNGYSHYASVYLVNPDIDEAFENQLETLLEEKLKAGSFGVSRLAIPGVAVRLLANSTPELEVAIDACQYLFRRELLRRENRLFKKY